MAFLGPFWDEEFFFFFLKKKGEQFLMLVYFLAHCMDIRVLL